MNDPHRPRKLNPLLRMPSPDFSFANLEQDGRDFYDNLDQLPDADPDCRELNEFFDPEAL